MIINIIILYFYLCAQYGFLHTALIFGCAVQCLLYYIIYYIGGQLDGHILFFWQRAVFSYMLLYLYFSSFFCYLFGKMKFLFLLKAANN